MEHTTQETNRHMEVQAQQVNARLDGLQQAASSSSERLDRILGPADQPVELEADMPLKRKRAAALRVEEKQAEKRRKLEHVLEIPLEEGDTLQDGVVLRGDLGRQKMHGFQAVREFRLTSELRCRLVEIGETATLQLDPLNQEQLKALESLKQNAVPGIIVKLLAVTKDGPVEAQFLKEKLCGLNRRAVTPLAMRFTSASSTRWESSP